MTLSRQPNDKHKFTHIKSIDRSTKSKAWFNKQLIPKNGMTPSVWHPIGWKEPIVQSKIDPAIPKSASIDINQMATEFANCTMPLELWDHYGRLKIVYYSVVKYGLTATTDQSGWLCTNWKKYKQSIGHGNLWHYTLTCFWAKLLTPLIKSGKYQSFDQLYQSNPELHNGKLYQQYYTNDILFQPDARIRWIAPNLKKLDLVR